MTLGWGIIGIGRIAADRMAPAINAFECNKLVAVVSRDQGRADAFASEFNAAQAYTSYEHLLARPDVDVVLITTPNSLHAEQAIAAARAGKHVYCDKPMANTVEDARQIVEECGNAGVKLGVNFHNRFMPAFLETKRRIDSGEIGDVVAVHVETSAGKRPLRSLGEWRADPAMAGHGTIDNVGVHLYDVLRFILSAEITTVSAFFDQPADRLETLALSIFAFDNGVLAQINTNEKTPFPHNDFIMHGTKGRITGVGLTRSRFSGELQVLTDSGETRAVSRHRRAPRRARGVLRAPAERRRAQPIGHRRPAQRAGHRRDGALGA